MKVSQLWLREWVNKSPEDAQKLASLLTMAGLEVDAVSPVAGQFDKVVVAFVKSTKPHPQADKLTLCEVDCGEVTPLSVVCGASNVRAGLKVALAKTGATLPGDFVIKETMLRGELSQGMLCSLSELGLADVSDGIMELDKAAPIGADLRDYLELNDTVLDIDLTPNRADCFSVLGIARELSALTNQPLKPIPNAITEPAIDETLALTLNAGSACPHYCGRILRGINPDAQTPVWMSERLRRAGLRSIHPVVDVTNYVMLELGQPMHAFDLARMEGGIVVRFATNQETLTLLDGQDIALNEKVLLVCDTKKPLAMAGVMGGEDSAVNDSTHAIFLESAFFNPLTIAGVARRFGLCTDSSQRFERGVDPKLPLIALERATQLLLEIVGGTAGPVSSATETALLPPEHTVLFKPSQVKRLTGLDISESDMTNTLRGLGMTVEKNTPIWKVTIPSHRFDITLDADLVEEIIRVYGYDKMQGAPMTGTVVAGTINPYEMLSMRASQFFTARGYRETISYSFVDPALQQALYPQANTMELLNPISSELSQMRVGMWSGLLASMIYNIHRQQTAIAFFENGVVFDLQEGELKERQCIAGLLTGEQGALNWGEKKSKFDFYDLKGDLEALLALFNLKDFYFEQAEHPALHPGKAASIRINQQHAGWCGVLHPRIADELDLTDEVILFELNLDLLTQKNNAGYRPISKFPQIRRDLSFLVDEAVSAFQIECCVKGVVKPEWLKAFDIFDVYKGEGIPAGKKSLAIALTLQDDKRTLIDNEINVIIDAIIKALDTEFSILLRD
ncbi:MAG: phenylalanine--tRNA ligase subunit beta [Tatlockia sp.]|jgi:phenylalanyl-tRNA synthetase beta chain